MTKYRELAVSSLGLEPKKFTASGAPAVSMDVLSELAGNPYEVSAVELCHTQLPLLLLLIVVAAARCCVRVGVALDPVEVFAAAVVVCHVSHYNRSETGNRTHR